jgi:ribosomal protein S18 acetylase RimI-like enzyme
MSASPIQFRPVQDQDLAFLFRLYASTREQELALIDWDDAQKQAFLAMQFEAQHNFYRDRFASARFDLILRGEEPIGRLYVDRRADEIRIIDIALVPAYRNRGIGGRLLRELLDQAATARLPVRIHVERLNPALSLYRRLGFEHIADNGVYYLMEAPVERDPSPIR